MLIVDRIVGDFAVCEREDRSMVEVPLVWLPENVREGDCLRRDDEGYILDPEETQRRRNRNADLFRSLLEPDDME